MKITLEIRGTYTSVIETKNRADTSTYKNTSHTLQNISLLMNKLSFGFKWRHSKSTLEYQHSNQAVNFWPL